MQTLHTLTGKRSAYGVIARSGQNGGILYVDHYVEGNSGRMIGWMRVPIEEVGTYYGNAVMNKVIAESEDKLR